MKQKYTIQGLIMKMNMQVNVWLLPRGRSGLSFCPILVEMQPPINSPQLPLDCTASHFFAFWHRISYILNQFECKFYTLAWLKYCAIVVTKTKIVEVSNWHSQPHPHSI